LSKHQNITTCHNTFKNQGVCLMASDVCLLFVTGAAPNKVLVVNPWFQIYNVTFLAL